MISSTFKTNITGDSYKELLDKAQEEISTLLGLDDPSEALTKARCEMIVTTEDDLSLDFNYRAEVIARIK
jgi:hypothetical protein